jgi:hypothetical protein
MIAHTLNNEKLFIALDKEFSEVINLISSANEKEINIIPFENSWTAGQLVSHITKSNKAIAQALDMEGKPCDRDPASRIEKIKKIFLDFSVKFKSPEFIVPADGPFKKDILINNYRSSCDQIKERRNKVDLTEIISLPAFGEVTKFEILYFVVFHTQRHIRQLKNILKIVNEKNHVL